MRRQICWLTLTALVWANVGPAFAQTPQVWGVNSGGDIYRWTGSTWQQIPGGLKNVAVGADGTVWGVNHAGGIWRWSDVSSPASQRDTGCSDGVGYIQVMGRGWGARRTGDGPAVLC